MCRRGWAETKPDGSSGAARESSKNATNIRRKARKAGDIRPNENKLSHGSGERKWQLSKAH